MSVFVDSSALLAVMIAGDDAHKAASQVWKELVAGGEELVTTSYVLLETYAILQRRHGLRFVELLRTAAVPEMHVHWITPAQHEAALSALLAAGRRQISLVDCASFVVMRELGLATAFTLDSHFAEEGYEVVPH
jgi:predicted nucleic acid-binding protein